MAQKRSKKPRQESEGADRGPHGDDEADDDRAAGAEGAADADDREDSDGDGPEEVVAEVVADMDAEEDEPVVEDDDEAPRRRRPDSASPPAVDDKGEVALSRYDPMQAYLREVQRHPLLTPDQELSLATKYYTTGDVQAAHRLVTANLRLVVKIAYEYRRAYKNIMDLVQEGNVGLMQAVKKFDPARGVKLSSYAAWWIRAYILRYILNNWRMVKLGTTQAQRKLFFNLNKEKQKLLAIGIDPSAKAIAERLHVDEKEVEEMDVRLGASEASLDAPVGDADGKQTARVDLMAAGGDAVDALLADAELAAKLKDKLASFRTTLKGKDLEIFDLRLVAPDEPLTLQELGDRFGVSRERVRQLEARLVGKLRHHLRDEIEEST